ncbi:hypothetical protein [Pedobacter sp.]|uniref:hypothetical protein n=1 Tax=Pedobacter sp. TaxID=1411316 RepID=UPI003C3B6AC1
MKTAEEILKTYSTGDGDLYDTVIEAMKEYARQSVYHHLIRAADNAKAASDHHIGRYGTPIVDRDSILKTEIITP